MQEAKKEKLMHGGLNIKKASSNGSSSMEFGKPVNGAAAANSDEKMAGRQSTGLNKRVNVKKRIKL